MTEELAIQKKEVSRDADIERVQGIVSKNITQMTASAIAAAIGATVVLKVTQSPTGSMKYVPIMDEEEVLNALEWISQYGNEFGQEGFFIIQQRPPDPKFWDMLTQRHLGKVPDAKGDVSKGLKLSAIGKKAAEITQHNQKDSDGVDITDPIPSTW